MFLSIFNYAHATKNKSLVAMVQDVSFFSSTTRLMQFIQLKMISLCVFSKSFIQVFIEK